MSYEQQPKLKDVFLDIENKPANAWLYLPKDKNWNLNCRCEILESEEIPSAQENDPQAGIPDMAKQNGLMQVLPVTIVQDIIANAKAQKHDATQQEIFRAFNYYYKHDAFI